jgi:hypothetical protein
MVLADPKIKKKNNNNNNCRVSLLWLIPGKLFQNLLNIKGCISARHWLTPVHLAIWESFRMIQVRGQPGQIVLKTPISKITKAK